MGSRASKEIPIAIGAYLGAVFFIAAHLHKEY